MQIHVMAGAAVIGLSALSPCHARIRGVYVGSAPEQFTSPQTAANQDPSLEPSDDRFEEILNEQVHSVRFVTNSHALNASSYQSLVRAPIAAGEFNAFPFARFGMAGYLAISQRFSILEFGNPGRLALVWPEGNKKTSGLSAIGGADSFGTGDIRVKSVYKVLLTDRTVSKGDWVYAGLSSHAFSRKFAFTNFLSKSSKPSVVIPFLFCLYPIFSNGYLTFVALTV